MKFEKYLLTPKQNSENEEYPSCSSVFWYFNCYKSDLYQGEGPFLTYKTFMNFKSQKPLYSFAHNDLAIYGRHEKVHFSSEKKSKTWIFKNQSCENLTLEEGQQYFWNYGGYFKIGCLEEEIEQILFTIRYSGGEIVPFFIRASEIYRYPNACIIT